ncbi:MAG: hypothetical protein ACR2QK_15825 [Acidimicrobiales bacterium]
MTDHGDWADFLSGETTGGGLEDDERAALQRIGSHLGDEAMWEAPSSDGQFRLLAAAAAEAAAGTDQDSPTESTGTIAAVAEPEDPASRPALSPLPSVPSEPRPAADESDDDRPLGADAGGVERLDRRRGRRQRATWFGAGALAAAAAAAIALISTGQLTTLFDDGGSTDDTDETEVAIAVATYDLAATELDPDTVASVEVRPTVAGVEFELTLMALDNTEGPDYYSAWLVSDDDAVPLGSFHWRAGGVPIILWSGVDDPAYNRFMVTRQVQGDGGVRSDQVVLMGMVPVLTADE